MLDAKIDTNVSVSRYVKSMIHVCKRPTRRVVKWILPVVSNFHQGLVVVVVIVGWCVCRGQ
jgi:hypothetical protein